MPYTLPRDVYSLLEETFGSKEKAEKLAKAIEIAINDIDRKAEQSIVEKKDITKIQLKDELKNELVTRELFEERFKVIEERFNRIEEKFKNVDERFSKIEFKINILIVIMLILLTFANPAFIGLIEKLLNIK